ncbi:unnamed protein product [Owenia fusiformis]|uniref:Uncharacterized protein n=1 Tax=Owenia fusiformis TaxID=6347 RepID=A0A8J1UPA6_OWEFU|nr:unnamed protein product [Owenia fusiformis]
MDDDFDYAFEDELDAMNDMEEYSNPVISNKSKKSLDFTTPKSATRSRPVKNLNDSFATPLTESPGVGNKENDSNSNFRKSKKRDQSDMFGDLSDDDDDLNLKNTAKTTDSLPDITPQRKRARHGTASQSHSKKPASQDNSIGDDSFEITPPSSPVAVTTRQQNRAESPVLSATDRIKRLQTMKDNFEMTRERVLKRPPNGQFFSATGEGGQRAYMTLKDESNLEKESLELVASSKGLSLLGTSITSLMNTVRTKKLTSLIEESTNLSKHITGEIDSAIAAVNGNHSDIDDEVVEETNERAQHLWVDRYAPHKYTELLSDESTNRTLLHWLKMWDYCVFNKDKRELEKKREKKEQQNQKKNAAKPDNKNFDNKKFDFKKKFEQNDELDQFNRPEYKVALLCGPPGLGKTTLGHIIGRHAGYHVVEMNASDDRSVDAFRTKIEAATSMQAVMGADARPNCLVIDEIDGAPQPAINILLQVLKNTGETAKKKKQKDKGILRRPIICICNDPYVPSLRQLRQIAMVLPFQPPIANRLASRLLEISRKERLKTDQTTLLALCTKMENDIRSCLNTLQFIQQKQQELTLRNVQSMGIGLKDQHKSFFEVWKQIFQMPKAQRKRFVNPHDREKMTADDWNDTQKIDNTSTASRFQTVLSTVQATGDYGKIIQGVHENYPQMKIKDPRLDGLSLANEWFCFADLLNRETAQHQNYILQRYVPYLMVTSHLIFATNHVPKLQYPTVQNEITTKLGKSSHLVEAMMNEMCPNTRKFVNYNMIVMDILPHLIDIIQPTLRPVNTQLYSAREKESLEQLIRIMIAYNLTYHQEKTPEGQYQYILDPGVDEVSRFPGMKPSRQLTYSAKQVIAREIDLEKMRRTESHIDIRQRRAQGLPDDKSSTPELAHSKNNPNAKDGNEHKATIADKALDENLKKEQLPNHLQFLKPKKVKEEAVIVRDFFGRVVKKREPLPGQEVEEKKNLIGGDIWYCFKEGFSNAVRRNVRISDLK